MKSMVPVKSEYVIEVCNLLIEECRQRHEARRNILAERLVGVRHGSFFRPKIIKNLDEAAQYIASQEGELYPKHWLIRHFHDEIRTHMRMVNDYILLKNMAIASEDGLIYLNNDDFHSIQTPLMFIIRHKYGANTNA